MKRTKIIIFLIISALIITPITTVSATSGKLRKASIVYCNNTKYGIHGKTNHWHRATAKNYASGETLRVPCGLDSLKLKNIKQTKKSITISYKKINKITGYAIYRSTGKKYTRIATTKNTYYKDTKIKKGKTHTYKVKVYKKIGSKTYYGKSITTQRIKKV